MQLKNIAVITLVFTIFSYGCWPDAAVSKGIEWQSYADGMARGQFEKKNVFIHFYADWCSACKTMADTTFKDPGVIASLNENFIPIRVNVDTNKQTSALYRVQLLPDTWFIAGNTDIIGHQPGLIPAEQLKDILNKILAGDDNN